MGAVRKADMKLEEFFPLNVKPSSYSRLPMSQDALSWNTAFQEWIEKYYKESGKDFGDFMSVQFPSSVHTTPKAFEELDKNVDITLAIYPMDIDGESEMSFFAQGGDQSCDRRLDVPMSLISGNPWKEPVILDAASTPDTQSGSYLVIPLREVAQDFEGQLCILNGRECWPEQIQLIKIRFSENKAADELLREIGSVTGKIANVGKGIKDSQESRQSMASRNSSYAHMYLADEEDDQSKASSTDSDDELLVPELADPTNFNTMAKRGQGKVTSIRDRDDEATTAPNEKEQSEDIATPSNQKKRLMQGKKHLSPLVQESSQEVEDIDGSPFADKYQADNMHSIHKPSQLNKVQSSLAIGVQENSQSTSHPRSNPLSSSLLNLARPASPNPSEAADLIVDDDSSSPDILRSDQRHKLEQQHKSSIGNDNGTTKTIPTNQSLKSVGEQDTPLKQITAKKTAIIASASSLEVETRPRGGKISQNKLANEAESGEIKNKAVVVASSKLASSAVDDQNRPQKRSMTTNKDSLSQKARMDKPTSRTSIPTKEKGEKNASGARRATPSSSAVVAFKSPDDITSPESHDASTPKNARNAVMRTKIAPATNSQNEPMAKAKDVSNGESDISRRARPSLVAKKYSLKAKHAISNSKPSGNLSLKDKEVVQREARQDLQVKGTATKKKTETKAKPTTTSSNRSKPKANDKSAAKDNEQDIWEVEVSDSEGDHEESKVEPKVPVKSTKAKSKGPKRSGKVTAKKEAAKKKQSISATVGVNAAPRRSQREAAVKATSKMSQMSPGDDESETEDAIEIEPRQQIHKDSKPRVSKNQTKAPKPVAASTSGKVGDTATSKTAAGNKTQESMAKNKPNKIGTSNMSEDNAAASLNEVFEKLQEDAVELSLACEEKLDDATNGSDADIPIIQTRDNIPNKGGSRIAANIKDVLSVIDIGKSKDDGSQISYKNRLQKMDPTSEKQEPLKASVANKMPIESSVLQFSSSPNLQPTSVKAKSKQNDRETQVTTQPEGINSVAAPSTDKRNATEPASNPSKRRRLDVKPVEPLEASKAPKVSNSKSKQAIPKTVKASTPPLRRSPRLHLSVAKESDALQDAVGQETVLVVVEELARKTPVIAFGNSGPRNQGVSSSKRITVQQESIVQVERTPSKSQATKMVPSTQLKRKRDDKPAIVNQDERPLKRVNSQQSAEIQPRQEEYNVVDDQGLLDAPGMEKKQDLDASKQNTSSGEYFNPGTPKSHTSSVVGLDLLQTIGKSATKSPVHAPGPLQKMAVRTSKVDRNGSPIRSSTTPNRVRKVMSALVENEKELGKGGFEKTNVEDAVTEENDAGSVLLRTISKSPARLGDFSSNVKAKPAAPGAEQRQYIPHRETGGDKYEAIGSLEVVRTKPVLEDPFAEQRPQRKLSGFTERLLASKAEHVETRFAEVPALIGSTTEHFEKPLTNVLAKPTRRSKSENDKIQVTAYADVGEPVQHPNSRIAGLQLEKNDLLAKGETTGVTNMADEVLGVLPEPVEPSVHSRIVETRDDKSQQSIANGGRPKRKISFELQQDQSDNDNRQKRIKSSFQIQPQNLEVKNQERSRIIQQRAAGTFPRAKNFSLDFSNAELKKPSFQDQEVNLDGGGEKLQGTTQQRATELLSLIASPLQRIGNVLFPAQEANPDIQDQEHHVRAHRQVKTSLKDLAHVPPVKPPFPVKENSDMQSQEHQIWAQHRVMNSSRDLVDARQRKSLPQVQEANLDVQDHEYQVRIQRYTANSLQNLTDTRPKKSLAQVQEKNSNTKNQEHQVVVQHRLPNARPRQPSFWTADTNSDIEVAEPRKKRLSTIENRQFRRTALQEIEHPAPEIEELQPQPRRTEQRPVTKSMRQSRGEFEDPEKTLVDDQPPPSSPSDMTSGSSVSSHDNSSVASPMSAELSPEEEWGVELRSHDRPILKTLYRIVNVS